jgi:poly-gamma-glutamate synthesis protein (capsule biosynthesis protein)
MGIRWGGAAVRAGTSVCALFAAAALAGCGLVAEQNGQTPRPAVSGSQVPGSPVPGADASNPAPSPTPTPTPGKGTGCAVLRCTSVLVTGDMLVHSQLWQQAQQDAAAAGKPGYDFVPLLEGQRRYIIKSDLAVCHQETPVSGSEGPFSAYPSFNVPPQIIAASKNLGYQACTTGSNHTIDRGTDGLLRTLDALDAAGLKHTGSYRTESESQGILIMQTPAAKVAIIEAAYGLNGLVPDYPWQVDMLDAAAMIAKAVRSTPANRTHGSRRLRTPWWTAGSSAWSTGTTPTPCCRSKTTKEPGLCTASAMASPNCHRGMWSTMRACW